MATTWPASSFDLPHDCNANVVGDACDIASGASTDLDGNGYPDECCVPVDSPLAQSGAAARNRYLSMVTGNPARLTALRVKLSSLNHPDPPGVSAPLDFSSFEGQVRWVGPPAQFTEPDGVTTFQAADLQCSPHIMDWGAVGTLHVYGDAIVPDSAYEVQAVEVACLPGSEANFSTPPLSVPTARWSDVAVPFQQTCAQAGCSPCTPLCVTQPNALDVAAIVDVLKVRPGAIPKVQAQLRPNTPNPAAPVTALDIVSAVSAFKRVPYPYSGPTACPP